MWNFLKKSNNTSGSKGYKKIKELKSSLAHSSLDQYNNSIGQTLNTSLLGNKVTRNIKNTKEDQCFIPDAMTF
ncbi:hypothetical protein M8J76_013554 [Diaphorina citri]|nr:hypothetical protein M8J75_002917 [Diaphorina citri]KAI5722781.1 hypothetical protein M8J76_013554 [Diaphorina citri]KAI5726278.1 hypothetical protein M8J77_026422 [Diaphorina citri]